MSLCFFSFLVSWICVITSVSSTFIFYFHGFRSYYVHGLPFSVPWILIILTTFLAFLFISMDSGHCDYVLGFFPYSVLWISIIPTASLVFLLQSNGFQLLRPRLWIDHSSQPHPWTSFSSSMDFDHCDHVGIVFSFFYMDYAYCDSIFGLAYLFPVISIIAAMSLINKSQNQSL